MCICVRVWNGQIIKDGQVHDAAASAIVPAKKPEIISILKRRNTSHENVGGIDAGSPTKLMGATSLGGGSSVNSQTFSEDSNQDESDSDWDGFPVIMRTLWLQDAQLCLCFCISRIANAVAVDLICPI